jgi:hypothetical protein
MNRDEAEQFAREWIRDWCARDVDRVVSRFAGDARFVSPFAAKRTGSPVVVGREALTRYWQVAHSFSEFRFTLDRVLWDDAKQEMAIVYARDIDGRHDRACEIMRFNSARQVVAGEAMYGAEGI